MMLRNYMIVLVAFAISGAAWATDTAMLGGYVRATYPPFAISQKISLPAGNTVITLRGDDPDNDSLIFKIVSLPTHGNISSFDPVAGTLVYSSEPAYTGSDEFTFQSNDGRLNSIPASVELTIRSAVNHQSGSSGGSADVFVLLFITALMARWNCPGALRARLLILVPRKHQAQRG